MEHLLVFDYFNLSTGLAIVLFNSAGALRNCSQFGKSHLRAFGRSVNKVVEAMGRSVRELCHHVVDCHRDVEQDLEFRVREELADMRFRETSVWIVPIFASSLVMHIVIMLNIVQNERYQTRWMSDVHDISWLAYLCVYTILVRLRENTLRRCLQPALCFFFILLAVQPLGCDRPENMMILDIMTLAPRLCLTVWCFSPISILCNGVFAVTAGFRYAESLQGAIMYETATSSLSQTLHHSVMWHCAAQFGFSFVFTPLREVWKLEEARRIVQLELQQKELGAARALLNTICDAVVELDSDYRFEDSCPQFGAMLMLGGNVPHKGSSFLQYMSSQDDEDYFIANITRAIPFAKGLAHAFHLQMKDSVAISMRMQMYHIPCQLFGQTKHLIGISEMVQGSPAPATDGGIGMSALNESEESPWLSERSQRERKRLSDSNANLVVPTIYGAEQDDGQSQLSWDVASSVCSEVNCFRVSVDACSQYLKIQDCSYNFSNNAGLHIGDNLLNLIQTAQREMFKEWTQEMCNRFAHKQTAVSINVILRPPHLKRFGVRIFAVARVEPDEDAESEETGDECLMITRVVFDELSFSQSPRQIASMNRHKVKRPAKEKGELEAREQIQAAMVKGGDKGKDNGKAASTSLWLERSRQAHRKNGAASSSSTAPRMNTEVFL